MTTKQIRLTFLAEDVSAIADLREAEAPATCAALWDCLPVAGTSHHASYSGSECVLLLPEVLRLAPENARSDVHTGDVAFTWFAAGASYGFAQDFAEICWFYDNDACPSMPEGPVPVSIFASIRDGSEAFYAVCRRMRREGIKSLLIERVPEADEDSCITDVVHQRLYRHHRLPASNPRVFRNNGELQILFTQHTREQSREADSDLRALHLSIRSRDGGNTWSEPEAIPGSPESGSSLPASHKAELRLDDDRRLAVSARKPFPYGLEGVLYSDDESTQKTFWLRILPDADISEPALLQMEDGTFLCVYHAYDGTADGSPPGRGCGIYAMSFRLR